MLNTLKATSAILAGLMAAAMVAAMVASQQVLSRSGCCACRAAREEGRAPCAYARVNRVQVLEV